MGQSKFFKRVFDKEIKESILENNPVQSSNFLSRQKFDNYFLEILSEAGKKDKTFSGGSLIKAQENLVNIMDPLYHLWEHSDHLKINNLVPLIVIIYYYN